MKTISTSLALLFSVIMYSQPGSSRQVGKTGAWGNTLKAVEENGKIYTIDKSGSLFVTEPATGTFKQIGKESFPDTKLIFASNNTIYTITDSGNLKAINSVDGTLKSIGNAGAWIGAMAGTILNGKLYTTEKSGALYATDLSTGNWSQIGNPDFGHTIRLWAANGKLYSHDVSGSLYEINVTNGSTKQIGATEGWIDTMTGVVVNNLLYTIESSGTLYETDLNTGKWKQIGNSDYQNTVFMTGTGSRIHTIENSGSLIEISLQ